MRKKGIRKNRKISLTAVEGTDGSQSIDCKAFMNKRSKKKEGSTLSKVLI